MLTLELAAEYLGMSVSALRARIATARRRNEWEPFERAQGSMGVRLLVKPALLDKWVATWTGRRGKRPRRASASEDE